MTHSPSSTPPVGLHLVRPPVYLPVVNGVDYSRHLLASMSCFGARRDATQDHLRARMTYGHLIEMFTMPSCRRRFSNWSASKRR